MKHVLHIQKNKDILEARFEIIRLIREFFWSENFLEVETPNIVNVPGQEPYLDPMKVEIENEIGDKHIGYLHTSPEYTLKKMLAAGFENVFSISKCYRNKESFGGLHNPEFTMLEFYRMNVDFYKIMEDIENLLYSLKEKISANHKSKTRLPKTGTVGQVINLKSFHKIHMRDLWQKYVGVNLDDYLDKESLLNLVNTTYNLQLAPESYSYEDLFYKIFLNKIEPNLIEPTIVHHYPAQMSALSKISQVDPRYAERFEVYINGIEIANAFSELTDQKEQENRLEEEKNLRKNLGKDLYEIDKEFLEAVKNLSNCAGIALGVDRLIMVLLGINNIDDILALPMSKLFTID